MALFRKSLAIDMGSKSFRMRTMPKGLSISEPCLIAYDNLTDEILAVGIQAERMPGRTPGNVIVKGPIQAGVVNDYSNAEKLLKYYIKKASAGSPLAPDVMLTVPSEVSQIQIRAMYQLAKAAGAHNTYLVESPIACCLALGIDIYQPGGYMVADIGGGLTDIAVISMGEIVISSCIRTAGNDFDKAIAEWISQKHNLIIGERTAEFVKKELGCGRDGGSDTVLVRGRSLKDGLPSSCYISESDVHEALEGELRKIVKSIHSLLSNTPPELAADLYDRGILLTGGGSLIKGLDMLISEELSIDVHRIDNPILSQVRGCELAFNKVKKWNPSDVIFSQAAKKQIKDRERLRVR